MQHEYIHLFTVFGSQYIGSKFVNRFYSCTLCKSIPKKSLDCLGVFLIHDVLYSNIKPVKIFWLNIELYVLHFVIFNNI